MKMTADAMTDLQVRDEAMTIFLAGHETSANAMAWSWYLLAQHPEVEARFHAEVDEVLAGRAPRMEDVPRLPLTGRIFSEALRLYPPLWAVGRRALQDCEIGGYSIADRLGHSFVLLRHASRCALVPGAGTLFDPERWTAEARAARPKFSYFPFSAGSRSCLGEAFASMEGVLCLAALAQKWRLEIIPEHPIALQPQLTLRARHGIKMRAVPRA